MLQKNCNNCACNKVCNHDEWGFENCGNWIFQSALDPDQQRRVYYPKFAAALAIGDNATAQQMASEGTQRYYDLLAGVINGREEIDMIWAALAAGGMKRTIEEQMPAQQLRVKEMLERNMMTIRVDPNAMRNKRENDSNHD